MTRRKRFGLSQNLNQGLKDTINAAENHTSALRYEVIALSRIELDPENPRNLLITVEDIKQGLSLADGTAKDKQEELNRLTGLAETIKKQGLINPVVVYKFGEKYRLVAGERRFLASLLAGKDDIQARVLNQKPDGLELRLLQWVENTEREDLSLKDRIGNVMAIVDEHKKQNLTAPITATLLRELISISLPQATAYIAVLNAPKDVIEEINLGKINNLDKAAYLAKIHEEHIRRKAIEAIITGTNLKQVKALIENEISLLNKPSLNRVIRKRGRVASRVNLGTTTKPTIIKKIIEFVILQPKYNHLANKFNNINWSEYQQTSKAFRVLIEALEKEGEE